MTCLLRRLESSNFASRWDGEVYSEQLHFRAATLFVEGTWWIHQNPRDTKFPEDPGAEPGGAAGAG